MDTRRGIPYDENVGLEAEGWWIQPLTLNELARHKMPDDLLGYLLRANGTVWLLREGRDRDGVYVRLYEPTYDTRRDERAPQMELTPMSDKIPSPFQPKFILDRYGLELGQRDPCHESRVDWRMRDFQGLNERRRDGETYVLHAAEFDGVHVTYRQPRADGFFRTGLLLAHRSLRGYGADPVYGWNIGHVLVLDEPARHRGMAYAATGAYVGPVGAEVGVGSCALL